MLYPAPEPDGSFSAQRARVISTGTPFLSVMARIKSEKSTSRSNFRSDSNCRAAPTSDSSCWYLCASTKTLCP